MSNSAKANIFNVKRIVYAKILKDDTTAFNHGPIKNFGAPMQVALTPSYATGVLYGGGVKTEDMSKITGAALKADVNKVPIEVRADIYGHEYSGGELIVHKDDQAPEIAIGYEMEATGNNQEFVWLFKGRAKPFAKTVQQTTDNMNFSTDSIEIGFVPREHDGELKRDADTANPDFTSEKAATYLDTIPGGTLVTT
jgi:phi13 family phage major tail protein